MGKNGEKNEFLHFFFPRRRRKHSIFFSFRRVAATASLLSLSHPSKHAHGTAQAKLSPWCWRKLLNQRAALSNGEKMRRSVDEETSLTSTSSSTSPSTSSPSTSRRPLQSNTLLPPTVTVMVPRSHEAAATVEKYAQGLPVVVKVRGFCV